MINLLNSFDNYETWCFQINHCLEEHKLLCSVNTPFMHAKEKTTKIQYFWAIFFPLRVSLTHRHMFRFFWHQGTVTGCSLCLTTQPVTDFLLIDPIIGAIIIIPNHKEMDCTLFRIFFFLSHTHPKICAFSLPVILSLWDQQPQCCQSFRKEMNPDRKSVTMTPVNQYPTENTYRGGQKPSLLTEVKCQGH